MKSAVKTTAPIFLAALCLPLGSCDTMKPINTVEEALVQEAATAVGGTNTPAAADEFYRLLEGDAIAVDVYRRSDLQAALQVKRVAVDTDGSVVLPAVGSIEVAGLTVEQASNRIKSAYAQASDLKDPEVGITLVEARGRRFFIMGEVTNPGAYNVAGKVDIVEGVLIAGGLTQDADEDHIIILRRGPNRRIRADVEDLIDNAQFVENITLQPYDIVYVPPHSFAKAERFTATASNILRPFIDVSSVVVLSSAISGD